MVTVIDPTGAPEVIYNRSGTTLVEVTASGTTQSDATEIPHISELTVALITGDISNVYAVRLPTSAEIGDMVEVHIQPAPVAVTFFPPSGENINLLSANLSIEMSAASEGYAVGRAFRKVSATRWRLVGPA